MILVTIFTVTGPVIGQGNDQRVRAPPESLEQARQLTVDIPQGCRMRLFIIFLFPLHVVAVRIMNRRKIDIHKYFPVRRILFQFVDGKVHLIGSTVLIRATESRQPITLIEIAGKYPSYIIPLTEKVDSSDADCFITYLSQTLYERSLFESITGGIRPVPA